MGEPATIGFTDPDGTQREIEVPAEGEIVPKDAAEAAALRAFEGTDVLDGNTIGDVPAPKEAPKTKADLRDRLTELGAEQPPATATRDELADAVKAAEDSPGKTEG